jgi:addiction module HigA family antidote
MPFSLQTGREGSSDAEIDYRYKGAKLPPIHPGRILLEDMKDEKVSINALAQAIRVPANRISLIVNERRAITADTLATLFGTSPEYWLNIQNQYDLASIDRDAVRREVLPRRAA